MYMYTHVRVYVCTCICMYLLCEFLLLSLADVFEAPFADLLAEAEVLSPANFSPLSFCNIDRQ